MEKVCGVFVQCSQLVDQISKDQIVRTRAEERVSVSVISSNTQDLQTRNAMFMWFQLFIEVLFRMHHKASDRKELTQLCRDFYRGNQQHLEVIEEFEKHYTAEKAIWWYTRDACFYRLLNKALRVQDFDTLFAFRVLITDISNQIKREYENYIRTNGDRNFIRVYRGQLISDDELELMKNSIGEFLSMNSFFSTSRNRSTALKFVQNSRSRDTIRRMLFEIDIDPRLRTKAFADVGKISFFDDEDEVLIMLGALFRIKKVSKDENDRVWVARLTLASEDDYQLKEILSHMKGKVGDDTNLDSLGKLLLRMHENEKARKCYKRMLEETQLAVGDARLGLGWASLRCNDCDESLEHFQDSLKIRRQALGEGHPRVGECYSFIGEAYRKKGEYGQALIYFTKAVSIQEKTLPGDSLDLAATYDTIGMTYTKMKEYDSALNYYNKTLKIRQATLPPDHPQLAAIYSHIGWLHHREGSSTKALDYYQKALDISRKTLPPTHPVFIESENYVRKWKSKIKH